MDGTLVDTEPYWMAAETALVESFGGTWTHEQALTLVGQGLESSATILQAAGVRMAASEIIDHLTERVTQTIAEQGNPLRPGAAELLADLRAAGVRCALVTMSLRRMAEQVVAPFGHTFEVIVSGDDATRPKPYPDAYLQACQALEIAPRDAVAIEDSPTGVRAAVAEEAGIPCASLWASVPHYVAGHTPSPKATLALLDRLTALTGAVVARGELPAEALAWEASIDAAAAEDEEMTEYIRQLEQTRDTWDSPEASGDAIAQEFERYLRRGGEGPGKPGRDDRRQ